MSRHRRVTAAVTIISGRYHQARAQKPNTRRAIRRERHGTRPFRGRRLPGEFRIETVSQFQEPRMHARRTATGCRIAHRPIVTAAHEQGGTTIVRALDWLVEKYGPIIRRDDSSASAIRNVLSHHDLALVG